MPLQVKSARGNELCQMLFPFFAVHQNRLSPRQSVVEKLTLVCVQRTVGLIQSLNPADGDENENSVLQRLQFLGRIAASGPELAETPSRDYPNKKGARCF